ncbi:type IV secretory system conjugative DNA transfer family protein [Kribbella solani]|uniref:type IV secretory system conjugative DNA transfer family protein n=1 Tax=Kribbella solani TaxID=236067 RepID=UPI0029BDF9F7|nr:type IV secretion system DNA-binding domain-containing protein [Kribbella solani]MDX2974382.1 type IV secretion system DNA-binding domain-containing protein [Kribbella solani]
MATLYGAPRIILETAGVAGEIQWWISAPKTTLRLVRTQIASHLPGAAVASTDRARTAPSAFAAKLMIRGGDRRALNLQRAEATARSILSVLSKTGKNEELVLQFILGERLRPSLPVVSPKSPAGAAERRRLLAEKTSTHGFGCAVRIGVTAASVTRARQLIGSLLSALRTAEAADVTIQLRRERPGAIDELRSPWRWPLQLSIRELACMVGWPLGEPPFAGLPSAHPRPMLPPKAVATSGRVVGDSSAPGTPRPLALSVDDSLRHLLVLGPTGTGKSTLIGSLAIQDMQAGRSIVIIDPKQSLVEDVLWRVPAERRRDVVLLDATDKAPIGINPLVGAQPELAADTLVHLIHELYADNWGPRTQDILHASLLSLARRGDASLLHVPLLLTNAGFRRSVTAQLIKRDPMGLGTFWAWYNSISEAERQSVIAPVMNKLRSVLLRPGLRAVLGQTTPRFDMNDVFTKQRILLVSLNKGQLGSDGAKLLGSLVVNLLWQAATRRGAGGHSKPVMVFIDEVQDYLRIPGDLGDALATARGYGLSYLLATQHLGQLPPGLRSATLANARSKVMFQLSHEDAVVMARGSELEPEDFTSLGRYQTYASLLSDGAPTAWASMQTRPLPATSTTPDTIREHSRRQYGQTLSDVEASWAELADQSAPKPERLGRLMTEDE